MSDLVTLATLHYTDGKNSAFWVGRGRLRGPKGRRYFDWNAKDTVELADVPVCTYHRPVWQDEDGKTHVNFDTRPFNGLTEQLEAQYAQPDAPPVDWSK